MTSPYEQTTGIDMDDDLQPQAPIARTGRNRAMLAGVSALTLFFVVQILQLFPWRNELQVAKFTVLAVALIFLSSPHLIASRVRLRSVPQFKYILGLLALALITVPLSAWPAESLSFITGSYGKSVIFAYLLVQTVRTDRDSRVVAGTLVAGCALLVIAMFAGYGEVFTEKEEIRLAVGKTYDPNDLALLFVVTIPFAFFMLKSSRPLTRVLLISAIGLMLIGMGKGGSRGGFLGLIVVGALILLRGSRQARKYTLLTIAVGVMLFAVAAPSKYWERMSTIYNYKNDYNMTSEGGRITAWQTGFKMWATHPIAGIGISCFATSFEKYSDTERNMSPHNIFIQILAELGLTGLLLFTALIFVSIREARLIRLRSREGLAPPDILWLASAIEASFIGFLVSGFFLSHAYSSIFYFLVGMTTMLTARYRSSDRSKPAEIEEIEYA